MPFWKTVVKQLVALVIFLFCILPLHAQVFSNDAGAREKHFIYEVKQIDEFFERFNNDTGSFIRKVYKDRHIKYTLDRPKLVKSLFNYETKTWDPSVIDNFVHDVTNGGGYKLNFFADDWYAEAKCRFQYNGATIEIPVVLKVETDSRHRSKWVIAAVNSSSLPADTAAIPMTQHTRPVFINPASHANSFIELDKAFADKENLGAYFDTAFSAGSHSLSFFNAVLKNRVKFLYVKDVVYHFLQAGNWIFTVEYFPRESLNAGWLISSIRHASAAEKDLYEKRLLEK